MQLGITIPLERFLKMKKPPYGENPDNLFCWELHVILLLGQPCLVGVNCGTRFSFIRAGIKQEERDALCGMALQEIERSFRDAGISGGYTRRYLKKAEAPQITKTHGRSQVAYLNRAVELVMRNDVAFDSQNPYQPVLNDILNRTPTKCTGCQEPEPPADRLLEKLESLF